MILYSHVLAFTRRLGGSYEFAYKQKINTELSLFHCYFILMNYIKLLIWEKHLHTSSVWLGSPSCQPFSNKDSPCTLLKCWGLLEGIFLLFQLLHFKITSHASSLESQRPIRPLSKVISSMYAVNLTLFSLVFPLLFFLFLPGVLALLVQWNSLFCLHIYAHIDLIAQQILFIHLIAPHRQLLFLSFFSRPDLKQTDLTAIIFLHQCSLIPMNTLLLFHSWNCTLEDCIVLVIYLFVIEFK